ncbi:MAG: ABC transporter [Kangiellaceae bacterium]|nr:ABC transporter [Kangiellaceae bacterium]
MNRIFTAMLVLSASLVAGCAANPESPSDPWEPVNRKIYSFNRAVDKAILKPVTLQYDKWIPRPIDARVDSFISNLDDVVVVANDVLQLKMTQGARDTGRLAINSTIGLLGLFDVASSMGLHKNDEDFGQTLGYWGVPTGPYVMLPFLGPSTVRDAVGDTVDGYIALDDIIFEHDIDRVGFRGVELINKRQSFLDQEKLLEESFDEYVFLRDVYLQRREFLVRDGAIETDQSDNIDYGDDEDLDDIESALEAEFN